MANQQNHEICTNFGDSKVIKKSQRAVWNAFRIWESVKFPIRQNTNYYQKLKRSINISGNPPNNIFFDWIMDFSTIAAGQLGRRDWENFRNLVLIHVAECPFECWYCFNDARRTNSDCKFEPASVTTIIEKFLLQQELNQETEGNQYNVLRISGGEPFTQPELIRDLAIEIKNKIEQGKSIFLWVDTNLYLIRDSKIINDALEALLKLEKYVAIHACFHGVTDSSIKRITGKDVKISTLIDNYFHLKKFLENVYPRFNPCACTPAEVEQFFKRLYEKDQLVPSTFYMGIIELFYEASKERLKQRIAATNQSEQESPIYHAPQSTIFWWDKLMYQAYGIGYGIIPRHLCNGLSFIPTSELNKNIEKIKDEMPSEEFIFVSKGFYRENYALKVLKSIALPEKFRMLLELENKYVEPNFHVFLNEYPDKYKDRDVLITATHQFERDILQLVFLRWAKVKNIWTTPSATTLEVELGSYPYLQEQDYIQNQEKSIGVENFEVLAKYTGKKNLPLSGYFLQLMALPPNKYPFPIDTRVDNQIKSFFQIVNGLNDFTKRSNIVVKNVYYRVSHISRTENNGDIIPNESGILEFNSGEDIEINLESYNPNLGRSGFPQENQAMLNISCTAEENVEIVTPENIRLSKFGQPKIKLRVKNSPVEVKGEIVIKPAFENTDVRIIELTIPFITISPDI